MTYPVSTLVVRQGVRDVERRRYDIPAQREVGVRCTDVGQRLATAHSCQTHTSEQVLCGFRSGGNFAGRQVGQIPRGNRFPMSKVARAGCSGSFVVVVVAGAIVRAVRVGVNARRYRDLRDGRLDVRRECCVGALANARSRGGLLLARRRRRRLLSHRFLLHDYPMSMNALNDRRYVPKTSRMTTARPAKTQLTKPRQVLPE